MSRPLIPISTRGPISSVCMIDEPAAARPKPTPDPEILKTERKKIQQAAQALTQGAAQLDAAAREIFTSHRQAVIQLAMEIAAKILARDIQEKNYRIEQILQEALSETPAGQVRTIRLHPEDLAAYQQFIKENPDSALPQAHLISDWSLGPAECIIETEQGILDWLIEEQVRQVSEALLTHTTEPE